MLFVRNPCKYLSVTAGSFADVVHEFFRQLARAYLSVSYMYLRADQFSGRRLDDSEECKFTPMDRIDSRRT